MAEQTHGFWSTLPGILTGIAAIITAATGLYIAINNNPHDSKPDTLDGNPVPSGQPLPDSAVVKPEPGPGQDDNTSPIAGAASADSVIMTNKTPTLRPKPAFPQTGPLVDCSVFPTVNTGASLMSWSNYYHKQIVAAGGVQSRAADPCNKTIDYRGMAHCQAPDDAEIRQALLETLQLCRKAGIEWRDIQHTTIVGQ